MLRQARPLSTVWIVCSVQPRTRYLTSIERIWSQTSSNQPPRSPRMSSWAIRRRVCSTARAYRPNRRRYAPGAMSSDHTSARIEPWGDGDLPLLERLLADPAMMAHLGGPESRERIAKRQADYRQPGSRQYRIVDPDTGEGAGWVGYWRRKWQDSEGFEIGWAVAPGLQGRGLGPGRAAVRI